MANLSGYPHQDSLLDYNLPILREVIRLVKHLIALCFRRQSAPLQTVTGVPG